MGKQHTPGPWEHSGDGIWAASPWNARVRLATVTTFAALNGIDSPSNARLIAAAPELLEALKATEALDNRDDCEECGGEGEPEACALCFPKADDARIKRRAAITKATT